MLIIRTEEGFKDSPHYEDVKSLYRSFYEEEVGLHTQLNNGYVPEWNEFDDWLAGVAKYGNSYLVCTTTDTGNITGVVFFTIGYLNDIPAEVSLGMVYVPPEYRRKGIATELMEYVIQTAEDLSVPRIELTVVGINLPAIKLYNKFGFFTSFYYMNRKVG